MAAKQHQRRSQLTRSNRGAQLVPSIQADWEPPADFQRVVNQRLTLHRRAARELQKLEWGRVILPKLEPVFSFFWDWAIDEVCAKATICDTKRLMREKGRTLAWHRRRGSLTPQVVTPFDAMAEVLKSLRRPGRPGKYLFHDMVAFAVWEARASGVRERALGLEPLRLYLELPEFGYALPRDRMKDIAYHVLREVVAGDPKGRYPGMANVLRLSDKAASLRAV